MINKTNEAALTAERLRELLHYDPETGIFRWKVARGRKAPAGSVAGSLESKGYNQIKIDGRTYMAHRLSWLYFMERWPTDQIDHINGEKADNRFANLREATGAENSHNRRIPRHNTSGVKGVSFDKRYGKWRAELQWDGKSHYLGMFNAIEDAAAAVEAARRLHHGAFARARLITGVDLRGS